MKKLILKTILTSLLGVLAGLTLVWGIISLAFPGMLVKPFLNIGMEKTSAWYAASSYIRTHDLEDLADATEISIRAGNDKQVAYYGNIFIHRDGFDKFCAEKEKDETVTFDYKQFICGQVAVAYYRLGENERAFETAFYAIDQTFDGDNAVAVLAETVIYKQDKATLTLIYNELGLKTFDDMTYYKAFMTILQSKIASLQ